MDRPAFVDDTPHFTALFTEMKRNWDDKNLFVNLETHIRVFLEAVSDKYVKQMGAFQTQQNAIAGEAIRKLDELRASAGDASQLLRVMLTQSEALRIPKKGTVMIDVHESLDNIYRFAASEAVERSAAQFVVRCFERTGYAGLGTFLAQLATLSKTDYEVSLLKQFMMQAFPLDAFLFYADVKSKASRIAYEKEQRNTLLMTYFAPCGWGGLPKPKRQLFESTYNDPAKFPTFCLALYAYCIEAMATEIMDPGPGAGPNRPPKTIETWLALPAQELFLATEFMKTIAEHGKPGPKELAVFLFKRKVPFEQVLKDFDCADSLILLGFENFGKKQPRGSGARGTDSPKRSRTTKPPEPGAPPASPTTADAPTTPDSPVAPESPAAAEVQKEADPKPAPPPDGT
jgi:hypothetical protein